MTQSENNSQELARGMVSGASIAASPQRIVVAMSGGVDSSVTAALLKEQGHEVIGITLQLYDQGAAASKPGACCAGQDIRDARRVAEKLGIPHYVLDFEKRFQQAVIDDFVDTYVAGQTPIPCVRCNQRVKFRDLLDVARDLGASAMATGHYVRRTDGSSGPQLHQARDERRDQSYFLFATTREQLAFLRFPLGDLEKDEVRALAQRYDLPVASKPDSQDICFVPNGSYTRIIERLRPGTIEPGEVVDLSGKVLGRHDGVINFTIGQRRGLGLAHETPLYVVRIDAERRQVVVGPREALTCAGFELKDVNWLEATAPEAGRAITIKVRSTQRPLAARISGAEGSHKIAIDLLEHETAVAPGQAGVIYDGDRVLGGGWIAAPRALMAA